MTARTTDCTAKAPYAPSAHATANPAARFMSPVEDVQRDRGGPAVHEAFALAHRALERQRVRSRRAREDRRAPGRRADRGLDAHRAETAREDRTSTRMNPSH